MILERRIMTSHAIGGEGERDLRMETPLALVHEDDDLLVINKPAGLVCHPTKPDGFSSLISRVRRHLGPAVPPHLINRLDRETSGLVLVAKKSNVALELRQIWERRAVQKLYLAIVHGRVHQSQGVIEAPLGKDEMSVIAIKDTVRPDGAPARTDFRRLGAFTDGDREFSLLHVQPWTGRKHQIRIHLAYLGHPVVGDKLYGGEEDLYLAFVQGRLTELDRRKLLLPNHALHAAALCFHWRDSETVFRAEPEPWFQRFIENAGRPGHDQPIADLPSAGSTATLRRF
jgi:23S rRNA pseudouridine1911/1915/1917 synthase